jgi:hypothetical protein
MRQIVITFAIAALAPSIAEAREFRLDQVPNGGNLDCTLCHVASAGGGERNVFGQQVEAEGLDADGNVVWTQIYDMDADGDGFTNGFELGDPDGTWVPGPEPDYGPSLPQDPDSVPCGSENLHPDEECDGDVFADNATCDSLGFTGGTLACATDCTLDTSGCMGAPDAGMSADMGGGADDMGSMPDAGQSQADASSSAGADTGGGQQEEENSEGWGPYYDNPPPPPPDGCGYADDGDSEADAAFFLFLGVWFFRRRRDLSGR